MPLTIAGLQTPGTLRDVEANLRELEAAAEEAVDRGAELLITPEMFVTGYVVGDALPELAAQDFLGPVRDLAARAGLAVLLGAPELSDAGVHNAAYFIDDRGEVLSCYRKSHLFGELDRSQFVAGEELFGLVEFRGVRIATMICYDVEFPEVVRAAALAGAHLWENQVYVAYIDHDGSEEELTYVGRSSIVAPDATVLDSVEHGTRLLYATIDPEVVDVQQKANPYLGDRRAPLYPALTAEGRTTA